MSRESVQSYKTKPSHQEAIPANSYASPASAGSFNPQRFITVGNRSKVGLSGYQLRRSRRSSILIDLTGDEISLAWDAIALSWDDFGLFWNEIGIERDGIGL